MISIDQLEKLTSIVSHFTIIFAMIGLIVQVRQNWFSNKLAQKDRFVSNTSKYYKIQELLLSTSKLSKLNINIYKKELADNTNLSETFNEELALCGMMFQLMEDVWLMHDFKTKNNSKLYSGWNNLFQDWINTDEIFEKWTILKHHFSHDFIDFVEKGYVRKRN